jgi:hypothetical protein
MPVNLVGFTACFELDGINVQLEGPRRDLDQSGRSAWFPVTEASLDQGF